MKNKVLLTAGLGITDRPERWSHVVGLWEALARTFEGLGVECRVVHHPILQSQGPTSMPARLADLNDILAVYEPTHAFVWNGGSPADKVVVEKAVMAGAEMVFSELAWWPQKGTIYFDAFGTNAKSSFAGMDPTEGERFDYSDGICPDSTNIYLADTGNHRIVKDKRYQDLYTFREEFKKGKPERAENPEHVLVALQVEDDTNVTGSRFDSMEEFAMEAFGFAAHEYRNEYAPTIPSVLLRAHPKFPDVDLGELAGCKMDTAPLYESIMNAAAVYAINSTVLLEAAMLGVPIVPFDTGIIRVDGEPKVLESIDPLLALLLERQLNWGDLLDKDIVSEYPSFRSIVLGE